MRIADLFPSRFAVAAALGCAIFIPAAIFSAYGWGVAHHDRVQAEARAAELDAAINAPVVGFKDRLTLCAANLAGAQAVVGRQNKAVEDLATAAQDQARRAQASVAAAQGRAADAERRVQALLSQQPLAGEARCDAADRLILEEIQ